MIRVWSVMVLLLWGMGCRRKARLNPCPSARPGVQTEGRLRGEPAAGLGVLQNAGPASPKLGGSRSEVRRGRSPKHRAARGATNDAPLRRTAGAAACARACGPAVAVPSGQSESAALGKMTRDPCAASAARVRSLDPRAHYRGVAGQAVQKLIRLIRRRQHRDARLTPLASVARHRRHLLHGGC